MVSINSAATFVLLIVLKDRAAADHIPLNCPYAKLPADCVCHNRPAIANTAYYVLKFASSYRWKSLQ